MEWEKDPESAELLTRRPPTVSFISGRKRKCPKYRLPGENLLESLNRLFSEDFITNLNVEDFLDFHKSEMPMEVQEKWIDTKVGFYLDTFFTCG